MTKTESQKNFIQKSIIDDIKLRWIIIFTGSPFLLAYTYFLKKDFILPSLFLIGFTVIVNIIYKVFSNIFNKKPVFYSYLTGIVDTIIATFAIYLTGGLQSPLFFLYFIIILDACFEYWAEYIFIHLTLLASFFYLVLFLVVTGGKFVPADIVSAGIKLLFLFLVCYISYYVAKTFSSQYNQLAELNEEKEKLNEELIQVNKNLEEKIRNAIEKLEKANMMLVKKNITLLAAHEIYKSANEIQSKETLLDVILGTLIPLLKGSGGIVLSRSRDFKTLKIEKMKLFSDFIDIDINKEIEINENSKILEIFNNKKAIVCESMKETDDNIMKHILKEGSCIATPLMRRGKVKNVLIIFNKKSNIYTKSDIELIELLGEQIGILLYSRDLYDEARKRAETLEKLISVTLNIEQSLNENEILKIALNETIEKVFPSSSGVIILQNESNILKIRVQNGFSPDILDREIVRDSICGWVCKNNKAINIRNLKETENYNPAYDLIYLKEYSIGAPIHIKNNVIGAIFITRDKEYFDKEDIYFLNILSNYLGSTIENAKLYSNIRQDYLNTIYALAAAVDAKDHYTHGHSTTVMKYSVKIAEAIGLPEEDVETIKYAALLHDIGKIGISENILNKPSKLTKEEYNIIKMHPQLGANIVSKIDSLKKLTTLILSHHEWINGGGYPLGLRGDEIPLGAKIISIADAYSTMTSKRPYREMMGVDYAIKELKKYAGIQFDAELVDVFIRIITKEQEQEKEKEKKEKKRIRIKLDETQKENENLNKDEKFYS